MSSCVKYNILYDATLLAESVKFGNCIRTGMFFVVINIFNELIKREDVNVSLFLYNKNLYYFLKEYQKIDKRFANVNIITSFNFIGKIVGYFSFRKCMLKNRFIKFLLSIIIAIIRLIYFIFPIHFLKNKIKNYIFLSPIYCSPKCIKKFSITRFVILHDTIPLLFRDFYSDLMKGKYWFLDLIDSMDNTEHYFAVSECTKNDFLKFVPHINSDNITVMPLASSDMFYKCEDIGKISDVRKKYNIPSDKKYIFSLCTIEPRKNIIFAIKNFITFIEKNKVDDLIFVLGGTHWDFFIAKFEKEIGNFEEYKNKIIRIGYVDDNDLAALYSDSFFFVYPTLYEGFGLPVLEAMQCGCPVITSNNSSIPEVVGDVAIKINPESDDDLCKAYKSLYDDASLREMLSKKGLERAKLFSWDKTVDIIMNEIKKIGV